MNNDVMDNWLERAKNNGASAKEEAPGVRVIKRVASQSRGNKIMEIAEKLRPWLTKMYEGVRDENGMIVQPSRVRGIALNVAQRIVHDEEKQTAGA